MCTQNMFGVFEPCAYREEADYFNGEIPDWEKRLAEYDACEPDENERDSWEHGLPTIDEWEWFFSVSYSDPMEV